MCASSSEIRSRANRSSSRSSDRAACFFDFFASGSTGIVYDEMKRLGDFADAENLDLVVGAVDEALALEGGFVDGGTGVEQIVEFTDVEDGDFIAEVVVIETTLRETTVKRHLATFETDTSAGAGAGFLTLVALTGGFTPAGAFAATETLVPVLGSRIRAE